MSLVIADKTMLVTGANRGLGRALVDEALRRGAKRVYAASRQPMTVADDRVTPVTLDVTDPTQIREAAESIESLDILINNAGVSVPDDLNDRDAFERHLAVNLYGPLEVTQALLPSLIRSRGAVVNVVSLGAVAAVPVLPAYSASKAASLSITQSLRALAGRPRRERSRRPARSDRHRHGANARRPEDAGRRRGAGDAGRRRAWRGGDLPGPAVAVDCKTPGAPAWRRCSSARTRRWSRPSRSRRDRGELKPWKRR